MPNISVQKLVKMVGSAFGLELSSCYGNETTSVVNKKACSMSSSMAARLVIYQADKQGKRVWMAAKQKERVRECKNWSVMLNRGQRPHSTEEEWRTRSQVSHQGKKRQKQVQTMHVRASAKWKWDRWMTEHVKSWDESHNKVNHHEWSMIIQEATQQAVTRCDKTPHEQTW